MPRTATTASGDGDEPAARDEDRLARDQALELAAGDERAGERDRADERAEDDEDRRVDTAPRCSSRMKSSIATSAAAPPPTALNSDTSCGIAVIFTPRPVYRPGAAADQEADDDDRERGRRSGRLHGSAARRAWRRRRRSCRPRSAGCRCGRSPASSSGGGPARSRRPPPARRGRRRCRSTRWDIDGLLD